MIAYHLDSPKFSSAKNKIKENEPLLLSKKGQKFEWGKNFFLRFLIPYQIPAYSKILITIGGTLYFLSWIKEPRSRGYYDSRLWKFV